MLSDKKAQDIASNWIKLNNVRIFRRSYLQSKCMREQTGRRVQVIFTHGELEEKYTLMILHVMNDGTISEVIDRIAKVRKILKTKNFNPDKIDSNKNTLSSEEMHSEAKNRVRDLITKSGFDEQIDNFTLIESNSQQNDIDGHVDIRTVRNRIVRLFLKIKTSNMARASFIEQLPNEQLNKTLVLVVTSKKNDEVIIDQLKKRFRTIHHN